MASPVDYRTLAHHHKGAYLTAQDSPHNDQELADHFHKIASATGGAKPRPVRIPVQMGRHMDVALAGVCFCLGHACCCACCF